MQTVTRHPRIINQELLTRKEAAEALRISLREWDRLRKSAHFTEFYILDGRKGLRFLGSEIEEYIWNHVGSSEAS